MKLTRGQSRFVKTGILLPFADIDAVKCGD